MNILTQDANTITYEPDKTTTPGHIIVSPKQKYVILEDTPDTIVGDLFNKANEQTLKIFQEKKVHGVNILVQNGNPAGQKEAQVQVHIIPRTEEDNIALTWNPRPTTEEHLAEAQKRITTALKTIAEEETKSQVSSVKSQETSSQTPIHTTQSHLSSIKKEENSVEKKSVLEEKKTPKEEIDYRIKHMRKIA